MKAAKVAIICLIPLVMTLSLLVSAHAALVNNGNGTITDTETGLMWLQDANYSMTSGYDADGRMNWDDAMAWADSLVYAGFDDWTLPYTPTAVIDYCINYNCSNSDMGNLYYNEGVTSSAPSPFF